MFSGSVARTVVTAVAFSLTVIAAVAPPPFEVITGASLTLADGDRERLGVGRGCRRWR